MDMLTEYVKDSLEIDIEIMLPQMPVKCPTQNLSPSKDLHRKDMTHLLMENQSAMSE